MEKHIYDSSLEILREELYTALGCTEPIAIALAAAKARQVLGKEPQGLRLVCSVNMFKNAKSVTVPNSGGMKGMEAAAVLGALGGDPDSGLEVLAPITEVHRVRARSLLEQGILSCKVAEDVDNLYISVAAMAGGHCGEVTIAHTHTSVVKVVRDGDVLFEAQPDGAEGGAGPDRTVLTVRNILDFAEQARMEDVQPLLQQQILTNTAIAEEGLRRGYGAQVGQALLRGDGMDVRAKAKSMAASGSDARMSGCGMPVVINSGSGNQGLTVTMPVLVYAEHLGVGEDAMYRALIISNLVSVHQKRFLGQLSAFCGAVTAASGAGAAITYLYGGTYEQICGTIINTIASVGGMVCDGAKPSCAAKISAALDAALTGMTMSLRGNVFQDGDGVVQGDIERTIRAVGHMGRVGMRGTDQDIIKLMLKEVDL